MFYFPWKVLIANNFPDPDEVYHPVDAPKPRAPINRPKLRAAAKVKRKARKLNRG